MTTLLGHLITDVCNLIDADHHITDGRRPSINDRITALEIGLDCARDPRFPDHRRDHLLCMAVDVLQWILEIDEARECRVDVADPGEVA